MHHGGGRRGGGPEVYRDIDGDDDPAARTVVIVGPGWSDAAPQSTPRRFAPGRRFTADFEVPRV